METNGLSRAEGSMFASEASNLKANAKHSSGRSGRDIDAERGSGRADPENIEFAFATPLAAAGRKVESLFSFQHHLSEKRKPCYAYSCCSPPYPRCRRGWTGGFATGIGAKIWGKAKFPFSACKPLISLKTAKGIFGNIWRKRPKIWKCLAWFWKGLEGASLRTKPDECFAFALGSNPDWAAAADPSSGLLRRRSQ